MNSVIIVLVMQQSYFSIGRYSGVLTTTGMIDRERSPYILFDIRASDQDGLYRYVKRQHNRHDVQ